MIMAVLGFLAPFLPDVIKLFQARQDHKHEMEMLKLRGDQAHAEATWRLAEIETAADMEIQKAVRKPHKSYGIQLLDKAGESDGLIWRWSFNGVFLLFSLLDLLISSVRPGVTYWFFGIYAAAKTATIYSIYQAGERAMGEAADLGAVIERLSTVLGNEAVWTSFDQEMLTLVLAFWFGERMRRRALQRA